MEEWNEEWKWCNHFKIIGVCNYADGSKYEGSWKDDQKCGHGTFIYHNKVKYEGLWKQNMKDSKGNFIKHNRNSLLSRWKYL